MHERLLSTSSAHTPCRHSGFRPLDMLKVRLQTAPQGTYTGECPEGARKFLNMTRTQIEMSGGFHFRRHGRLCYANHQEGWSPRILQGV